MNDYFLMLDFYVSVLKKMGWEEQVKHVFRKKFGNTSVEIREHLPTFGTTLELVVSFYNPDGCSIERISKLLSELVIFLFIQSSVTMFSKKGIGCERGRDLKIDMKPKGFI